MEKKRSLLVINQTLRSRSRQNSGSRTAMYFSREFSRLVNIEDDMIHHLIGDFTKDDITQTVCDFIKDSIRLHYPEDTQYLLYIYIDVMSMNLIDNSLVSIIQNVINENNLESRYITLVMMSDRERINQVIDYQLKNETVSFNWVTIFNKNIEDLDNSDDSFCGIMIMNLILVFIKYANAMTDIQLSELFELLLTEMHGSWVGDTQTPVLTVSNNDLLCSYLF